MKPTFTRSIDTTLLAERLSKLGENEVVEYQELSSLIKRDVTGPARASLMSAIHVVLAEHKIVIGTIRKVGVKRLNAADSVDAASASVGKIHREAKRGAKRIEAVKYEELNQGGKLKHNATAAVLAALHEGTTTRRIKSVEKTIGERQLISATETLAALAGK
jgi:hypothetical protein